MMLMRPETYVAGHLGVGARRGRRAAARGGRLRAQGLESLDVCAPGQVDELPIVAPVATETSASGEQAELRDGGYRFTARLEAVADPSLVVEGDDGRTIRARARGRPTPASTSSRRRRSSSTARRWCVTSASDPTYVEVLVQDGDRMRPWSPSARSPSTNEGATRTWLTRTGPWSRSSARRTTSWQAWQWVMVSRTEMAAFPTGARLLRRRRGPLDGGLLLEDLAEGEQVARRVAVTSRARARGRSRAARRCGGRRSSRRATTAPCPAAPCSRARSSQSRASAVPAPAPAGVGVDGEHPELALVVATDLAPGRARRAVGDAPEHACRRRRPPTPRASASRGATSRSRSR